MLGDGHWHLYDIIADPGETTPLERDQPEKFEERKKLYQGYANQMGCLLSKRTGIRGPSSGNSSMSFPLA